MKKQNRFYLLVCMFLLLGFMLKADNLPDKPSPPRLVNDFSGLLSAADASALEAKMENFNRQTSNQIALVIVNDLGDFEIADYSIKLGRKWGIGQDKLRNGILIVVKPKTPTSRGHAYIATGKGLEGAIPDATCLNIVDNEMIPRFKENDYYGGINAGVDVLMSLAKGEYNYQTYANKNNFDPTFLFVLIPILIMIFFIMRKRNRTNGGYTMGHSGWFPFIGGLGGWDNNSSSGSSNSDSGFSGFGGGDFGGGGAGGSW